MILIASRSGSLLADGRRFRCALGKGGVVSAAAKREGDHASPAGMWALRRVLYRRDRVPALRTALNVAPIKPDDGWCDDPADDGYNRQVKLPYAGRCERLWRQDGLYDVLVVLGYNDGQVRKGAGSAIFLHCASPFYAPTEGCVALARADLVAVLAGCRPGDALAIA